MCSIAVNFHSLFETSNIYLCDESMTRVICMEFCCLPPVVGLGFFQKGLLKHFLIELKKRLEYFSQLPWTAHEADIQYCLKVSYHLLTRHELHLTRCNKSTTLRDETLVSRDAKALKNCT